MKTEDYIPPKQKRGDGIKKCYAFFICHNKCHGNKSKCPYADENSQNSKKPDVKDLTKFF